MKVLHLPLKKEWYEMIERGNKREEYRELSEYWTRRLCADRPNGGVCPLNWKGHTKEDACHRCMSGETFTVTQYDTICFSCGYTERKMTFECNGISIGQGRQEWGAPNHDTFIIKLGKRVK